MAHETHWLWDEGNSQRAPSRWDVQWEKLEDNKNKQIFVLPELESVEMCVAERATARIGLEEQGKLGRRVCRKDGCCPQRRGILGRCLLGRQLLLGWLLWNCCSLLDWGSPSACHSDVSQNPETCLNREGVFPVGLIWECSDSKGAALLGGLQSFCWFTGEKWGGAEHNQVVPVLFLPTATAQPRHHFSSTTYDYPPINQNN